MTIIFDVEKAEEALLSAYAALSPQQRQVWTSNMFYNDQAHKDMATALRNLIEALTHEQTTTR